MTVHVPPAPPPNQPRSPYLLASAYAAGFTAGRAAGDRWARTTMASRAGGDAASLPVPALQAFPAGGPPAGPVLPCADGPTTATATAGVTTLPSTDRGTGHPDAARMFFAGFHIGLISAIDQHCRVALNDGPVPCTAVQPGGLSITRPDAGRPITPVPPAEPVPPADIDLSHLDLDRLRIGSIGVFAGDWTWTESESGCHRVPVGFVGLLIDRWNGWAVFSCPRPVAEAIVADQERLRSLERTRLLARADTADVNATVDELCPPMVFDGDDILIDSSAVYGEQAIDRISPDAEGQYVVMGWSWCWTAVAPADCDRIVGDLPTAGGQQRYVVLTHTRGMRVPHERLRVHVVGQVQTLTGPAVTANLTLDGAVVGTLTRARAGGDIRVQLTGDDLDSEGLRAFVAGCRRYGTPVTQNEVLDALVTEDLLTASIAAAQADDGFVLRLLDDDGDIVEVIAVIGIRRGPGVHAALRESVLTHPVRRGRGTLWEVWSGTAWQHLTRLRTADGEQS